MRLRGVFFFGVSAQHNHSHFMRAIVEGVNYALYQIAQSVEETIGSSKQVYASGGFINSRIWIQFQCTGESIAEDQLYRQMQPGV